MLPADVLRCLAHNLDPATGKLLRPHAKDGDRVGMDFTFNCPKSVSIARELAGEGNLGDARVEAVHREAVSYAVGLIERDMKTRVRAGGANTDRDTGELFAYRVTHRDTRTLPGDRMPDCHLHDHVFVINTTFDPVEQKYKAAQLGDIKHDAPFYEAAYMNRLASNLREIGYGVRREGKAFEVAGIDRKLIEKFSRRTAEVERVAKKLGIKNPASKAKLGATTRQGKTKETVEELNAYYAGRLTTGEKERLAHLQFEPSYESDAGKAVAFAVGHEFERRSVVEERKLYETALRHGIGSVTLEDVTAEAERQGVLLKDRQATTRSVLAEETRIIDFAREGKGACRPLAPEPPGGARQHRGSPSAHPTPVDTQSITHSGENGPEVKNDRPTLSAEQQALVNHVLSSTDRVVLVVGDAGTGKTHAVKSAFDRIHCPVEMLAPSVAASRGVLRQEGFAKADTVASFLLSPQRQQAVKGGVLWVDEAGLLPVRDLAKLTDIAREQDARLVLQGDPKQHRSVVRHGDMMNTLQTYASLPVGRLTEVWRQKHAGYKRVVEDIAHGGWAEGYDGLVYLGWVRQVEDNTAIVSDYLAGQRAGKEQILVAPSHAEGDAITAAIRTRLKADGKLGQDHQFDRLVNLNWSPAERGDVARYSGEEVFVFHRNSGPYRAGQEIAVKDLLPGRGWKSPEHFSVYRREKLAVAAGDVVRVTGRGKTADGHVLENGSVYKVKGFGKDGMVLANGWVVPPEFQHLAHGYVSTSHASQGKTVDRVLIAMGSESRGAMNAEQFYVSVSRGRHEARVYSDLPADELKRAIGRTDTRKSATELMTPRRKPKASRVKWWMQKARDRFKKLHELVRPVTKEREREKEYAHER